MDGQEVLEHRYRFFAEKGVELAAEQDRVLVTLFTGIIAGLVALLVSKEVGYWAALYFLLSEGAAVVGLGMCLMHMAFSSKVMSLYAAYFAGDEDVPNLLAGSESTKLALAKSSAFAQLFYSGQLTCLFWSALFAGLGIAVLVWSTIGWSGLLVAACFVILLSITVMMPLIKVYSLARRAFAAQDQNEGVSDG